MRLSDFLDYLKIIIVAAVIVLPIRLLIFQPFLIQMSSMEPNFHQNDYLFVDELSYKLREPKRGEIIIFNPPIKSLRPYIKRIIGLSGEEIEIKDGQIVIIKNGKQYILDESAYLSKDIKTTGSLKVFLEENEYFVLGDNRLNSSDSRIFGKITKKDIIGRAFLRVLPISGLGIIGAPVY